MTATERAMTASGTCVPRATTTPSAGPGYSLVPRHPEHSVVLGCQHTEPGFALAGLCVGARKLMQAEIGKTTDVAAWVAAICAVFATVSSVRWVKSWPNRRPSVEADLADGRVTEERFHFVQARRFQEPEHGGLIYFLRAEDDTVMVLFDHESQDLGVQGEDPLKSSFVARSNLLMVRSPRSLIRPRQTNVGDVLDAGAPAVLTLEPSRWPDDEELCDISWTELDARLSSPQPA